MSNFKKRVVIIEDHPLVRERLTQVINLDEEMEVCGEADNASAAFELIRARSPDLAIVDITLKNSSGLDLVKKLRSHSLTTFVLILSMHDEGLYAQRALRAGANGYLTKSRASEEVVIAAKHVLAGEVYLSAGMTTQVLRKLAPIGMMSTATRAIDRLTDRELAVMELIGRGHSSRSIANSLGIGVATVDTYRARIKEKMNLKNAFELQHFAIKWVRERE